MAKQEKSKTCPACGTRNKAKWEFCVRCGESLQGVENTDDAPATTVVMGAQPAEETEADAGDSATGTVFAMLLAVAGVGFFAYWMQRTAAPENPVEPSAFQIPTLPPSAPSTLAVAADDGSADLTLGRRLLAQGDLAGAIQALSRAVEKLPSSAEARSQYAQALFKNGDRDESFRQFEAATRLSPDRSYGLGFAAALNLAGRGPEAVAQYQRVLEQNPGDLQVLKELGSLLGRMGRFEDAATYLAQAAALAPNDMALQQEVAWAYESRGNLDQAGAIY